MYFIIKQQGGKLPILISDLHDGAARIACDVQVDGKRGAWEAQEAKTTLKKLQ